MAAESLVLLLILTCSVLCCYGFQKVCIVPDSGSQRPPSCVDGNVFTLDEFCQNTSGISDNTAVTLFSGAHSLQRVCEVANVSNVTVSGQSGSSSVTVECSHLYESGVRCSNVSKLTISGIEFIGCGGVAFKLSVNSSIPALVHENASVVLLFIGGSDLTLADVVVSHSNSSGMYINNVAGSITVISCKVANLSSNIGGSVIAYEPLAEATDDVRLTIRNCTFMNNRLLKSHQEKLISGGLSLFLSFSKLTLDISETHFIQNTGSIGGNMAIYFLYSGSVGISNCYFKGGQSYIGGGLSVVFDESPSNYSLSIINTTFIDNVAELKGGGVHVYWISLESRKKGSAHINILNSSFVGNFVRRFGGMALHVEPFIKNYPHSDIPRFQGHVSISKCTFTNHNPNQSQYEISIVGVIEVFTISYLQIDEIIIESNTCTALIAMQSSLVFSGSSKISNNSAIVGAGFQLTDSMLYFNPNSELIVTNNSALHTGGGIQIYSDCADRLNGRDCFTQFNPESEWNVSLQNTVNFTVANNHAKEGGDNTFGITLRCNYTPNPLYAPPNTNSHVSSISSNPLQVCIGDTNDGCGHHDSVTIYPGGAVTFLLRLVGVYSGAVSGTITASLMGDAAITAGEEAQAVGLLGRNVTYTIYSTQSYSATSSQLIFYPVEHNCFANSEMAPKFEIIFLDCPFGFNNSRVNINNSRVNGSTMFGCQCNYSNPLISSCSIQPPTITKKYNSSWLGMLTLDSNLTYLAGSDNCPLDYCNSSIQTVKSYPDSLEQDEQCQYNRTGVLCGSCQEGWSLVLGSSRCHKECSNAWLLLIILFALAGMLLVALIHFLNLTVTVGTVCGLIFYANVIQNYSTEVLSKYPVPGLTAILQIFLSWLNLDLGITTCFYNGMEAFGKALFLFVFPIYTWLLSAIIIILSNRYIFFTRLAGENSVKVLSTIILLSYSKMLRVTIGALKLKVVQVYVGDFAPISKMRWAVDGNIPYLDPQRHLVLFVLAVIFITLLIPFCVALLCIKHLYSLTNYGRMFSWINKLKPFFDTYTGPFKDKARFWTGLLLLVRLFLLIVHAVDYKDDVISFYIIIAVCLFLSATMFFLRGAYRRFCLDVLEYFFILNICAIFLINSYNGRGSGFWKSIITHLLVGSAFLVFLGILVYHIYLKLSHTGFMQRFKIRSQNVDIDYNSLSGKGVRGYEPVEQDLDSLQ